MLLLTKNPERFDLQYCKIDGVRASRAVFSTAQLSYLAAEEYPRRVVSGEV